MTSDRYDGQDVQSTTDFEGALETLLQQAVDAGVDVRGAWTVQTAGSIKNWDVEIVELAADGEGPDGADDGDSEG